MCTVNGPSSQDGMGLGKLLSLDVQSFSTFLFDHVKGPLVLFLLLFSFSFYSVHFFLNILSNWLRNLPIHHFTASDTISYLPERPC